MTGLKNISNTCYMNSVLQALRHVPHIKHYFCNDVYQLDVSDPTSMLYEVARLFKSLYHGTSSAILPMEFYNKFCNHYKQYSLKYHEDASEFLILLINHLNKEYVYEPRNTPEEWAHYEDRVKIMDYPNSYFAINISYQVNVTKICPKCASKGVKGHPELIFFVILPIDDGDFFLQMQLDDNFRDGYDEIPPKICLPCEQKILTYRDISYHPRIAIIVVKRYM